MSYNVLFLRYGVHFIIIRCEYITEYWLIVDSRVKYIEMIDFITAVFHAKTSYLLKKIMDFK